MIVTVSPGSLSGTIPAIASKSYAHRLLICAALSKQPSFVACRSVSADILATVSCLGALGASIVQREDGFQVSPIGRVRRDAVLDCGESGSTLRFMLPVVCALGGGAELIMRGRLPQRPLSPLYEELTAHGAVLSGQGVSPLKVGGCLRDGHFSIKADVSSQFISGLLLALPVMGGGTVTLEGNVESGSYIDITADCMRASGVNVAKSADVYAVGGDYAARDAVEVEGDWSNAAFWLCAGVMGEGEVSVSGLNPESVQGDRKIVDIIQSFGGRIRRNGDVFTACPSKLHGCLVDAADVPDLVPVVSVLAARAQGETRICNAGRLRLKESDRLAAVHDVMSTLGADISQTDDGLVICGGPLRGGMVSSWNDHRIAMSAAVAALGAKAPVTIDGSECVNKSYPGFYKDLCKLGGSAVRE